MIDKLIGDQVMALYPPSLKRDIALSEVPMLMLEHARALLRAVGYGSGEEPFVEIGVGLDIGEAYVGNIGQRALYDFTAVGDVVNTAARLQAVAGGGEIVITDRVANGLTTPGRHPRRTHTQGQDGATDRLPREDLRRPGSVQPNQKPGGPHAAHVDPALGLARLGGESVERSGRRGNRARVRSER